MSCVTFDGPNKMMNVVYKGAITNIDAIEIYSDWKEWVNAGNAQYQPAFGESVGGNALTDTVELSGYFFVRNDLGWRLSHEPYNYEIRINGDIYPFDPASEWLDLTPGDGYSVSFVLQRSSASMVTAGSAPVQAARPTSGLVWPN
jgi:hypothetical protein